MPILFAGYIYVDGNVIMAFILYIYNQSKLKEVITKGTPSFISVKKQK